MSDSGIQRFGSYVEAELSEASARATSIEQRAIALATTNFSVVTLFFVVQTALGSQAKLDVLATSLLWIGAIASIVSLLFSVLLLVPRKSVVPRSITVMESEARNMTGEQVTEEVVGVRVEQLQGLWETNSSRASLLLIGTIALGLAGACLSISLLANVLAV